MALKPHVATLLPAARLTPIGTHGSAILPCRRRRLRIIGTASAKDTGKRSATGLRDPAIEARMRRMTQARTESLQLT
jgi:hypothetical protein